MTLIITLLSGDYILQASDRRVTWRDPGSGAVTLADDHRNKVILYCNRFTMTYAGAADVDPDGTDKWLGRHFAKHIQLVEGVNALPGALTAAFQRPQLSGRRLAVLACGWRYTGSDHDPTPYARITQNYDDGTRQFHTPSGDRFLTSELSPTGHGFVLGQTGVRIPKHDWTRFCRTIRRAGDHRSMVDTILELMVREIRRVANQTSSVGKEIMLTVLPRAAATSEATGEAVLVTTGGPNVGTGATFHYVPRDSHERILYGPHFVCHGALLTDFKGGPLV